MFDHRVIIRSHIRPRPRPELPKYTIIPALWHRAQSGRQTGIDTNLTQPGHSIKAPPLLANAN